MRIAYHHRTRSTDAQRIHIIEIVDAFRQLGHEVEIISLVHPDTAKDDAERDAADPWWKPLVRKIPYAYESVQLAYNLLGIPLLVIKVLARRPNFIYERYSLFNFSGAVTAYLFRIPLILEVNSPFALEQQRDGEIRNVTLAYWSERWICNRAHSIIVVSTPLSRIMERQGIDPRKLCVMPNGVNLRRFHSRTGRVVRRRELRLNGAILIGFVGWFRQWHGLEMLVEAYLESGLRKQQVRLLLVGGGPAMQGLRDLVAKHRLQQEVVFTGPVPHEQVAEFMDLFDIAVQPAANEYCCPMKIIEYMAMGKPIVGPRQENIEELIREGVEGLLFQPNSVSSLAEALRRAVENMDATREMGRRAKLALEERGLFWTTNAARVVELARK